MSKSNYYPLLRTYPGRPSVPRRKCSRSRRGPRNRVVPGGTAPRSQYGPENYLLQYSSIISHGDLAAVFRGQGYVTGIIVIQITINIRSRNRSQDPRIPQEFWGSRDPGIQDPVQEGSKGTKVLIVRQAFYPIPHVIT